MADNGNAGKPIPERVAALETEMKNTKNIALKVDGDVEKLDARFNKFLEAWSEMRGGMKIIARLGWVGTTSVVGYVAYHLIKAAFDAAVAGQ